MGDSHSHPHDERDEDLLLLMAWKAEDPEEANAAFTRFYQRHVRYLYAHCLRAYADDLGHDGVEDLVHRTFWRAFEKAATFTPMNGEDATGRRARAWLGRIAQRLMLTEKKRDKRRIQLVTGSCDVVDNCPDRYVAYRELTREEDVVRRGMNEALSERERLVLESYASYYDPESEQQYPPDDVVGELCELLQTTKENIRQIRCRALRKLKNFITSQQQWPERVEDYVPR
jgi:RNA polymerase sigma factor (sigma-70 family)